MGMIPDVDCICFQTFKHKLSNYTEVHWTRASWVIEWEAICEHSWRQKLEPFHHVIGRTWSQHNICPCGCSQDCAWRRLDLQNPQLQLQAINERSRPTTPPLPQNPRLSSIYEKWLPAFFVHIKQHLNRKSRESTGRVFWLFLIQNVRCLKNIKKT